MTAVSALGTAAFYMPAFVLLAFGVRLRPMLCVLLALVLAGTATQATKLGFALPRPSEVDAQVLDKGEPGHALVERGAATAFWALPDAHAIATVRRTGTHDYGFISGHASAATAFALGLALFFGVRRRWLWAVAIGWALLMGVSRMYLGRHFLADVLGGWAMGALAVWLAWGFGRALASERAGIRWLAVAGAVACIGGLLLVSLQVSFLAPAAVGELAGAAACLALLARPDSVDGAGAKRRVLRVALALAVVYGVDALLQRGWDAAGWQDQHPAGFLVAAVGYPLAILGAATIAQRLGLYPAPAGGRTPRTPATQRRRTPIR